MTTDTEVISMDDSIKGRNFRMFDRGTFEHGEQTQGNSSVNKELIEFLKKIHELLTELSNPDPEKPRIRQIPKKEVTVFGDGVAMFRDQDDSFLVFETEKWVSSGNTPEVNTAYKRFSFGLFVFHGFCGTEFILNDVKGHLKHMSGEGFFEEPLEVNVSVEVKIGFHIS